MAKITIGCFGDRIIELSDGRVIYVLGRDLGGWQLADTYGEWADLWEADDIEELAEKLEHELVGGDID
jgi:hypothetical protein